LILIRGSGGTCVRRIYVGRLVTKDALSRTPNKTLIYAFNNDFDLADFTYAGITINYAYD